MQAATESTHGKDDRSVRDNALHITQQHRPSGQGTQAKTAACPSAQPQSTNVQQRFSQAYDHAARRKQLFQAYLAQHKVLEGMNAAMQDLFSCEQLPSNPLLWLAAHLQQNGGSSSRGGGGSALQTDAADAAADEVAVV